MTLLVLVSMKLIIKVNECKIYILLYIDNAYTERQTHTQINLHTANLLPSCADTYFLLQAVVRTTIIINRNRKINSKNMEIDIGLLFFSLDIENEVFNKITISLFYFFCFFFFTFRRKNQAFFSFYFCFSLSLSPIF